MKTLVIVATTVAIIAGVAGCGQSTSPEEPVTFADANLEAEVREAIDLYDKPSTRQTWRRLLTFTLGQRISPT